MEKNACPHCGAPLPRGGAFCPRCARSTGRRRRLRPPFPWWGRLGRLAAVAAALCLVAVGAAALHRVLTPQVYDGAGEVVYAGRGGTWQLTLGEPGGQSPDTVPLNAVQGQATRWPARLYVRDADSGADAGDAFLREVSQVTAAFTDPSADGSPVACTAPAPHDALPDAALVSFADFTAAGDFTARMVWTFDMKNGDVIRLSQDLEVTAAPTYDYDFSPMGTVEELQALLDKLADTLGPDAAVSIHLPAVTYEAVPLTVGRSVSFYGSAEGDRRTTFTAPVRVEAGSGGQITYFHDISFQGPGSGTALSATGRLWAEGCSFSGWDTGVLCAGESWGNVISCTFTGNGVGFHFNSAGDKANHSMYNDNLFRDNGTAVLLEQVPTDLTLNFRGSVFEGNGTDIDDRCGQGLDLSRAEFR